MHRSSGIGSGAIHTALVIVRKMRCRFRQITFFAGSLSVSLCLCGGFRTMQEAHAAETRVLTLDQALEIADSRNRDVLKAREFYNSVEGKYVEERSAALPQLSINGQVSRLQDDSQSALAGGLFPSTQNFRAIELGISQPLFTWGKVGAAIRAAREGYRVADERLRISRQETRRNVMTAFYDALLAKEQFAIARQNLEQKERHMEEAKRRHAAGVATDYDVLAASVSVENARPDLIRTGNLMRATRDRLRYLLALEEDVEVNGNLETTVADTGTYEEILGTARRRRPELEELRRRRDIASELVTIANAEDKPRLDAKGGIGWRQLETGPFDADGKAWSAGIFLSFPLFDGLKTRGRVAQAQSDRRALEIDEAKLADSISLEIRDAIHAVRESGEIVKALGGTVSQAERLLKMAEQGFELGVKIRLEVEDAEFNLLQARGNLARARRDYLVAQANLDRAAGILGEGSASKE
ncbi:TolC family protein [Geobacter sp. DSM 9736]|uniref:TolC family protein n=1 Tax=Geobacter sp. DSM 9736 TaxID=1277350 RepID=UPI000B611F8B|nr:TolC family protein [Geobacter sp. DSM 9736]SNB46876.1 Outer membrane protein TolC [Geobacter sp. DSM 9736]